MFLAKVLFEKPNTMSIFMGKVFAVASLFLLSFQPQNSIDQVVNALKSGSADQLSRHFDSRVDISLPSKSDNFSKKQAEMILRDFFSSYSVRGFQVKHKGEMNGSQFCIGSLQTRNGNFRTKIFMKQKGDQQLVQEIAFQAED